jgi:2-methylisocitrate lyase-like PEP mutase family enzyme
VRRARAYLDADVDCVYPIALWQEDVLRAFLSRVDGPVNIVCLPAGTPPLAKLAALGVARVSWGPFLFRDAMARFDEELAALQA